MRVLQEFGLGRTLLHSQPLSNSDGWTEKAERLNAAHGHAIITLAAFQRANPTISPEKLDEHVRLVAMVEKAKGPQTLISSNKENCSHFINDNPKSRPKKTLEHDSRKQRRWSPG